jgi:hypothetical protein
MPVNFNNPPEILVIHGVQTGENSDMRQNEKIKENLDALIANPDLHFESPFTFTSRIFAYEDINDEATYLVRRALASLTGNAIAGWAVDKAVDLLGDVFLAISKGDVYDTIVEKFLEVIDDVHTQQRPLYIVGHSLGSFYALEAINLLMADYRMAKSDRTHWPVQGLVTIGSPLGLELFKRGHEDLVHRKVGVTVVDTPRFPWKNYWDRQDPIVTGSLLGYPKESRFAQRFNRQQSKHKGWSIRAEEVNAGHTAHLLAHTAYWHDTTVGQGIINMVYRNRDN